MITFRPLSPIDIFYLMLRRRHAFDFSSSPPRACRLPPPCQRDTLLFDAFFAFATMLMSRLMLLHYFALFIFRLYAMRRCRAFSRRFFAAMISLRR